MEIIADGENLIRDEYIAEMCEKTPLFRRTDYIIESPLYRYRSNITWATDEIRGGHIYVSDMANQNDPFDASYAISDEDLKKEIYPVSIFLDSLAIFLGPPFFDSKRLWQGNLEEQMSMEEFIRSASEQIGISEHRAFMALKYYFGTLQRRHGNGYKIACFSETNLSLPMWAYYANNHRGICLEYDVHRLSSEYQKLRMAFCKVHYSEHRPRDLYGEYSLVVKSSQWAHEHEWRIICKSKENLIEVPCLSAVYLGMRFDREKVDDVISAIKNSGKDIRLFYCTADQERYALKFRELII